jgi:myo-inositol-1(or 4)-monophosphatase
VTLRDSSPPDDPLLSLAVELAVEGGRLALERWPAVRGSRAVAGTKTSGTDVVTEADLAVEGLLVSRLQAARPGDTVLGEEHGESTARAEAKASLRWVVDPIDGTVNYLYGRAGWAVSIGVEDAGGVCLGVVHAPATGETWTALRGSGAWLDGQPLTVAPMDSLAGALVATGFGYRADRRAHQAQVLAEVLPLVRDIRRAGAASLDLCAVASGRVDAYYEKGLQPWDLAAGGLVAQESGALVGGLRGQPASAAMTVAAGPGIFPELVVLLGRLNADGGP